MGVIFEHPQEYDLGSMFQESAYPNLSNHDIDGGGVAVVLISKVVPVGAKIVFDNGGGGYDLLPFQIIQHPFSKSIKVVMPNITIANTGGTYSITDDLRFKFLIYPNLDMVREINPFSFVQKFNIRKTNDGRTTLYNLMFPSLAAVCSSVGSSDVSGVIRMGNGITDVEAQHVFRLPNTLQPEKFIIDYPFELIQTEFANINTDLWVNFTGVIK